MEETVNEMKREFENESIKSIDLITSSNKTKQNKTKSIQLTNQHK